MPLTDQVTRHRLSRTGGVGLVSLATLTWAGNIALGRWLRNDIGPLTWQRAIPDRIAVLRRPAAAPATGCTADEEGIPFI
jgi:hypothetical protein